MKLPVSVLRLPDGSEVGLTPDQALDIHEQVCRYMRGYARSAIHLSEVVPTLTAQQESAMDEAERDLSGWVDMLLDLAVKRGLVVEQLTEQIRHWLRPGWFRRDGCGPETRRRIAAAMERWSRYHTPTPPPDMPPAPNGATMAVEAQE